MTHERDYLERTIATVRNHRGADNCWPQWANIFADEIERLWVIVDAHREEFRGECEREGIPADECLADFEAEALAEAMLR